MASTKMGAKKAFYGKIVAEGSNYLPTYEAWTEYDSGNVYHPHCFSEVVAINENLSTSEAKMNSNDRQAEYVKEVNAIDITYENKGLTDLIETAIFGHTRSEGVITRKESDAAPYIGFGFINVCIDSGTKYYQAVFYPKCKAVLGNNSYNTKGDNITFSGDSVTLHAVACNTGAYKITRQFDTEARATKFIELMLGVAGFGLMAYSSDNDCVVKVKMTQAGVSVSSYNEMVGYRADGATITASIVNGVLTLVNTTSAITYEVTLVDNTSSHAAVSHSYKLNGVTLGSTFTASYTTEHPIFEVVENDE